MYLHTADPHNSPRETFYPGAWASYLAAVPKLRGRAIKEYQQLAVKSGASRAENPVWKNDPTGI
jgi:hypothetical protein